MEKGETVEEKKLKSKKIEEGIMAMKVVEI